MSDETKTRAELLAELRGVRQQLQTLQTKYSEQQNAWIAVNEKLLQQIVEREWAEEDLKKIKKRYELAIKAGKVGVWDWDFWSQELYLDPFLQTSLGFETTEISTLDEWVDHVHSDDAERVRETVQAHFAGGTPNFELEHRMVHRDGSIRWFLVRGSTIRNENDKPYRLIGTNTDITEYKQAEAILRQYTDQLQIHNAELDAFAHTVAHDLKNPIGAMRGIAEVLSENHIKDKELYYYLQVIVRSGRKAENIVEELLILASVRQQDEIVLEPLDMARIMAETQERLRYQIAESNTQFSLPTVWPQALGYGPWIEEIWANYISNGIKYGGDPSRLELGATVQADGQIRFWVKDNGPGLSPADRQRLFTPFTQLRQAKAQGYGLGLSIVRRIVEKLGGEVGIEGAEGEGSIFYFTLPPCDKQ